MRVRLIIYSLIGIALLSYAVARAYVLPITHDESTTCLDFATTPVTNIVSYVKPIPNNHILNTLLVKAFAGIFGMNTLSVRIPNLLAFIIYFVSAICIATLLSKKLVIQLMFLSLLLCNHYLFDFFSLARGYGLASAFVLAAVCVASLYMTVGRALYLVVAIVLAGLAVYSNFSTLVFFIVLTGLLAVLVLVENQTIKTKMTHLSILFIGAVCLAGAVYIPLKQIVDHNELAYWGTKGFFHDTTVSLVRGSIYYNQNYLGVSDVALSLFITFLFFVLGGVIIYVMAKSGRLALREPTIFYAALFIGVILTIVLQFHLVQTPYPTDRAAVPLFPLAALAFIGFAKAFAERFTWFKIPAMLIAAIGLFNFAHAVNMTQCREWWYDANTRQVIAELRYQNKSSADNSLSLTMNWLFYPSFLFYKRTEQNLDWLNLVAYYPQSKSTDPSLYHYGTSEEKPLLDKHYELVKTYNDRCLMRHLTPCALTHQSIGQ